MSYDISFWKDTPAVFEEPLEIYKKQCKGVPVDGLPSLPVEEILKKLVMVFPAFNPSENFPNFVVAGCSIEVIWSQQRFRFDFRGEKFVDALKEVLEVMRGFDCSLYDPQLNKTFGPGEF